jgi:hypothetical protein
MAGSVDDTFAILNQCRQKSLPRNLRKLYGTSRVLTGEVRRQHRMDNVFSSIVRRITFAATMKIPVLLPGLRVLGSGTVGR